MCFSILSLYRSSYSQTPNVCSFFLFEINLTKGKRGLSDDFSLFQPLGGRVCFEETVRAYLGRPSWRNVPIPVCDTGQIARWMSMEPNEEITLPSIHMHIVGETMALNWHTATLDSACEQNGNVLGGLRKQQESRLENWKTRGQKRVLSLTKLWRSYCSESFNFEIWGPNVWPR